RQEARSWWRVLGHAARTHPLGPSSLCHPHGRNPPTTGVLEGTTFFACLHCWMQPRVRPVVNHPIPTAVQVAETAIPGGCFQCRAVPGRPEGRTPWRRGA
ncbi:unnamed protein product, partial [Symbiodinium pilosum]